MKVLSFGWGVQSFTLAAMAALGDIEMPDVALHADTTYESSGTYAFASEWTPWLEARGVRVVTVQPKRPEYIIYTKARHRAYVKMPVFMIGPDGRTGLTKRHCTFDWKIKTLRQWEQANRNKQPVEEWIGISTDEASRMRSSDVKYITNRYPLIELGMSRNDCRGWLANHGLPEPPKSACIFCPFRSLLEWNKIKNDPVDWKRVVEADNAIRNIQEKYQLYLHRSCKPITEVDLRTENEKGQLNLWDE